MAHQNFSTKLLGFEDIFNTLESLSEQKINNYPPHNIIKLNDVLYRIELGVSGLKKEDVEITYQNRRLTISYVKKEVEEEGQYLHRGLSCRSFTKHFMMADDYYEVTSATIEDGVLTIDISHKQPEDRLPKKIEIT